MKVVNHNLDDENLAILYELEAKSQHSLAESVVNYCRDISLKHLDKVEKFKNIE
jgi:cation transport ATPase